MIRKQLLLSTAAVCLMLASGLVYAQSPADSKKDDTQKERVQKSEPSKSEPCGSLFCAAPGHYVGRSTSEANSSRETPCSFC